MMNYVKTCTYAICGFLAGFYGNHELVFWMLLVLRWIDTLTWAARAFRLGRLRSRSMWYWTVSKAMMMLVPLTVHMAAEAVQKGSGGAITSVIFATMCVAEAISILQNVLVFATGNDITEQDAMSKVLNGILTLLNKMLEKTLWHLQSQK